MISDYANILEEIKAADDRLHAQFVDKLQVNYDLDRTLVSFQANKTKNGHRWYKYKEGFSSDLVRYIMLLLGLTALVSSLLFFLHGGTLVTFIFMFLLGATTSVIFPLIISLAGLKYKQVAGTVLGVVKLGIPVGGIVIPFILSLVAQWWSFGGALLLFPIFSAVALLLMIIGHKRFSL